jgi:PAS domain-containing protein
MYWEQDAEGRYRRIDSETKEQALIARQLLGRTRWSAGGLLVGPSIAGAAANPTADGDWREHRELLARGRSFAEMVWSLPVEGGGRSFLVESGRPQLGPDGAVTGFSGLLREIGGALAAERATQSALTALRVAPEPALLIESSDGPAGWRVRWANAAACAMLGRTDTEIVAASPQLLFGQSNQPGIETIASALTSGHGASRANCPIATGGTAAPRSASTHWPRSRGCGRRPASRSICCRPRANGCASVPRRRTGCSPISRAGCRSSSRSRASSPRSATRSRTTCGHRFAWSTASRGS